MIIATFKDGTVCCLDKVHGEGFDPKDGEIFLFEFLDGSLKEGAVHTEAPSKVTEAGPVYNAIFDRETRTVSIEA